MRVAGLVTEIDRRPARDCLRGGRIARGSRLPHTGPIASLGALSSRKAGPFKDRACARFEREAIAIAFARVAGVFGSPDA